MLDHDPVCFYLTESVKDGASSIFDGRGLIDLYMVITEAAPLICTRWPRIRRALERAKTSGSRMDSSPPQAKKEGG